jgi:hypothetical protein
VLDPEDGYLSGIGDVITPEESGDHTLLLFSQDGKAGDLSVTVGGFISEFLSVGGSISSSIDEQGDVVDVEINLDEGGRYTITLDSTDFVVSATDDAGEPVAVAELDDGEYQLDAATTGAHHLRVAAAENGGTGSFSITVDQVPDFEVSNLVDGEALDPNFYFEFSSADLAAGDYGRFKVEVRGGVTISITAGTDGTSSDYSIEIYEDGDLVDDVDEFGAGSAEVAEYEADGFAALEVNVYITNDAPGRIDIAVERV